MRVIFIRGLVLLRRLGSRDVGRESPEEQGDGGSRHEGARGSEEKEAARFQRQSP